ncbi:outer membrane biosynthesis protein TonB [Oceanihabitans sediminis]|uniref:hypothetical protein n=1 Tax=Oceanihabitans sediminis TaxID=1812012 RepID=UPI000E00BF12|nr:hypothetical protein [Oceanihabitans sediminis]MDX1773247.1 hypothetical protein [Oceanihabitans sediminis]RBP34940.1 outer membrane biosynthesis protein TonB [Oceanihabitans sediminis]
MTWNNKQKALCITILMAGLVLFILFQFHISKQEHIAETFYEIEPAETLPEEENIEKESSLEKAETNQAHNQNQKREVFSQAYKRIAPPEDYIKPDISNADHALKSKTETPEKDSHIKEEERNAFSKINKLLKTPSEKPSNNARSTVHYSLVNRKHKHLPIPIYLCEEGGKIIINITVNASGKVIDTSYNNASSSSNKCLIDSAIEYAKMAIFNSGSKKEQLGTITFYFEGK